MKENCEGLVFPLVPNNFPNFEPLLVDKAAVEEEIGEVEILENSFDYFVL